MINNLQNAINRVVTLKFCVIMKHMPTVNFYYHSKDNETEIAASVKPLKTYIAKKLTCGEINLSPDEVSIRILYVELSDGMMADVELDITAANFSERVDSQDRICLDVQAYIKQQIPSVSKVNVWLNLHELGHSFE